MSENVKVAVIGGIATVAVAALTTFGTLATQRQKLDEAAAEARTATTGAENAATIAKGAAAGLEIPSGAVLAFDLAACPTGWSNFNAAAGRVILGEGTGRGLATRDHGETGGREAHSLTIPQLPPHAHEIERAGNEGNDHFVRAAGTTSMSGRLSTSRVGEAAAFEIMPPFIVLRYCRKI